MCARVLYCGYFVNNTSDYCCFFDAYMQVKDAHIDGETLLTIDDRDLVELKVGSIHHRRDILRHIEDLRNNMIDGGWLDAIG